MTAANFSACLAVILREEGGNSDDPHDHGGRTSRGVTQREYDAYRSLHRQEPSDVWSAPQQEIEDIYRSQYWNPYCDDLPSGLDLVFFDFCVNAGRQQAVKALQRAVGVPADGMFGIRTKEAIDGADIGATIHEFSERRRAFYQALRQFPRYGKGWMARATRVERIASGMANAIPRASGEASASPKANSSDVYEPVVSPETGAATAVGGGAASSVLNQLQEASGQLSPYADTITYIKYAIMVISLVCVGLTIYGIIRRRKTSAAIGG